jgi:hypothetical protein
VEAGRGAGEVTAVEHRVVEIDELGDVQAAGKGFGQQHQGSDADFQGAVERIHADSSLHQVSRSSFARWWHRPLRSMTSTTGARIVVRIGVVSCGSVQYGVQAIVSAVVIAVLDVDHGVVQVLLDRLVSGLGDALAGEDPQSLYVEERFAVSGQSSVDALVRADLDKRL